MNTSDKSKPPVAEVNTGDDREKAILTRVEHAFRKAMDNKELQEYRAILEEYYQGTRSS